MLTPLGGANLTVKGATNQVATQRQPGTVFPLVSGNYFTYYYVRDSNVLDGRTIVWHV